jgi:hypothetical protein
MVPMQSTHTAVRASTLMAMVYSPIMTREVGRLIRVRVRNVPTVLQRYFLARDTIVVELPYFEYGCTKFSVLVFLNQITYSHTPTSSTSTTRPRAQCRRHAPPAIAARRWGRRSCSPPARAQAAPAVAPREASRPASHHAGSKPAPQSQSP